MAAKRAVTVDVVSDTICPWCFIGKRRLEKAARLLRESQPGVELQVRWRPFFLDPTLPKQKNKLASYHEKFGKARVAQMIPHMREVGREEGIAFSYGGDMGNTLDSHCLIEWADTKGKQDAVVEELFKRYFEREENVADHEVLVDAAKAAGLDEAEARQALESDSLREHVLREVETWRERYRISGVPFFVVNDGRASISGAQGPEELADLVRRAVTSPM